MLSEHGKIFHLKTMKTGKIKTFSFPCVNKRDYKKKQQPLKWKFPSSLFYALNLLILCRDYCYTLAMGSHQQHNNTTTAKGKE